MQGKTDWFENEAFWLSYAPIMFDDAHWAEAAGVAKACADCAGLSKGASVLDACCGPGRLSIELALLGLNVTGVDLMEPFLAAARESVLAEGVTATFLKADMRTFTAEKPFDLAINVYNSFGYCATPAEDALILRSVYNALSYGGTFVLECISRETAVKYFTEGEWFYRAGKTVLTEFAVEGAWEGLSSTWILIDNNDGSRIEHTFVQRLYSAPELRDTLRTIGFTNVQVYGGFDFSPYDQHARTMVLVAKK